jgi:hypothetical protein
MFVVVDGLETHYFQWTGYSGVTFLPLRCGFICPVTSTARWSRRHHTISEDWLWCTISWNWIIGPIFFDDTVRLECYCKMIFTHLMYVDLYKDGMAHGNFQQDNAAACTHNSCALLCSVFRDWIILKDMLPPSSPDLTPPVHYPWRKMKGTVYKDIPHTLLESISNFIRNIPPTELSCVFASKKQHVNAWLHICGGHFQNCFVM